MVPLLHWDVQKVVCLSAVGSHWYEDDKAAIGCTITVEIQDECKCGWYVPSRIAMWCVLKARYH